MEVRGSGRRNGGEERRARIGRARLDGRLVRARAVGFPSGAGALCPAVAAPGRLTGSCPQAVAEAWARTSARASGDAVVAAAEEVEERGEQQDEHRSAPWHERS
ncbi:hypothetical protein OG586_34440 [Streptomyces murinus]|uniref:hypothetical protein n=1 Tax=Streptomyces murinus TaxID=33900 RepID=UPI002E813705|nr:hypothetical protein [Streptomyces murinus]WUD10989.1 hypothetical protein OG586_34440 [Streptomyces murinus]